MLATRDPTESQHIAFTSLLKCCAATPSSIDTDRGLQIMDWMDTTKYTVKPFETRDYSRSVSRLITACSRYEDIHRIDCLLQKRNVDDVHIATALINGYARTNAIDDALSTFRCTNEQLRNSVHINAMMTVLVNANRNIDALSIYDEYGSFHNDISHNLALKACTHSESFQRGIQIHRGLQSLNMHLSNTLIDFYGHFGDITTAMRIFEGIAISQIDSVSVNNIIKAVVHNEQYQIGLDLYRKYEHLTDDISHVLALKAAGNLNQWDFGRNIHRKLEFDDKSMNLQRLHLRTTLVDFYGKMGDIDGARSIFEEISADDRDGGILNAMMNVLMDQNQDTNALALYHQNECIRDGISHVLAIKCCSKLEDYNLGKRIHRDIIGIDDSLKGHLSLKHTLIDFYGNAGDIETAEGIYHSISSGDSVTASTINVMKTAYYNNGQHQKALDLYAEFSDLQDDIGHVLAIKACICLDQYEKGLHIVHLLRDRDAVYIKSTMIDFYGHFKDIQSAEMIFESVAMEERDSMCINAMIKAYQINGDDENAVDLYDRCGEWRDDVSHLLAIKSCNNLRDFERGKKIHRDVVKCNGNQMSLQLKNTLIDLYGKFECLATAKEIYESIPNVDKTTVTVNAMMDAMYKVQRYHDCVALFECMEGINPNITRDVVSYAIVLKSCIDDGLFEYGQNVHREMEENVHGHQWMLQDGSVQGALINLYGKHGMMAECEGIFEGIKRDGKGAGNEGKSSSNNMSEVNLWHAMFNAYSRNGQCTAAQRLYDEMKDNGLVPDRYVFIALLSSFSHSGDAQSADRIWREQIDDLEMRYDSHIVASVVDCFSRAGELREGFQIIAEFEERTGEKNEVMWTALLSGCRKHNDMKMTKLVHSEMASRFDLSDPNSSISTLLRGL